MLEDDWSIILNDTQSNELLILVVPAGALNLNQQQPGGLSVRSDRPELIDLLIARDNLVDKRSGIDFSPYLVNRVAY